MGSFARDADYFRRRAVDQAGIGAAASDERVRALHRELSALYEARAQALAGQKSDDVATA